MVHLYNHVRFKASVPRIKKGLLSEYILYILFVGESSSLCSSRPAINDSTPIKTENLPTTMDQSKAPGYRVNVRSPASDSGTAQCMSIW